MKEKIGRPIMNDKLRIHGSPTWFLMDAVQLMLTTWIDIFVIPKHIREKGRMTNALTELSNDKSRNVYLPKITILGS